MLLNSGRSALMRYLCITLNPITTVSTYHNIQRHLSDCTCRTIKWIYEGLFLVKHIPSLC